MSFVDLKLWVISVVKSDVCVSKGFSQSQSPMILWDDSNFNIYSTLLDRVLQNRGYVYSSKRSCFRSKFAS